VNSLLSCMYEETAVTALEYALLAGLLAVVIVAAVSLASDSLAQLFTTIKDQVVLALS